MVDIRQTSALQNAGIPKWLWALLLAGSVLFGVASWAIRPSRAPFAARTDRG